MAKFKSTRLVAPINYNKVQLDGPSREIMPMDPLPDRFRAFDWSVASDLYDGNGAAQILNSFAWLRQQARWPAAAIHRTRTGMAPPSTTVPM